MTYVLMVLLVLVFAFVIFWGAKYDPEKKDFMSLNDSEFLRGGWCIVILLVHIPVAYQNRIQDMIGSFAFVGVTFFFFTSGYGLRYSIEAKKNYGKMFWRKRLPAILVPAIIANIILELLRGINNDWQHTTFWSFIDVDSWVKVLLMLYLFFWLIFVILPRIVRQGLWQDVAFFATIVILSVVEKYTSVHPYLGWVVEPLGFAYGVIVARYSSKIKNWMNKNWKYKCIVSCVASLMLGMAYLKFKSVAFLGDYLIKVILGIAIITFIFLLLFKFRVGNKINKFLSKISYEIYLLHGTVFLAIQMLSSNMNSGIFINLSVIATVLIAAVIHWSTEPLIRRLRRKIKDENSNG